MIRLLSVQPVAERGGSDHLLVRMLRSLPPDEFDCHVALPGRSPLAEEFAAAGAGLHSVPMERLSTSHGAGEWAGYAAGWPVAVGRLVRLIRRLRIDVVHSNSLHSLYGWAAAAITRRPHVWHRARSSCSRPRRCGSSASLLVTSRSRSSACRRRSPTSLIPRTSRSSTRPSTRPSSAPSWPGGSGTASGSRTTLHSWERSGASTPGRASTCCSTRVQRAKGRRPDLHLVVAGAPVTGKEQLAIDLATRATQLAGVHWLGPRTDTPELFADLDLFVLPSTEPEPYGIVVVEALASGAPVVVTDAGGGAPEIVAGRQPGAGGGCRRATPTRWLRDRRPSRPDHQRGARSRPSVHATRLRVDRFAAIFRQAAGGVHGRPTAGVASTGPTGGPAHDPPRLRLPAPSRGLRRGHRPAFEAEAEPTSA